MYYKNNGMGDYKHKVDAIMVVVVLANYAGMAVCCSHTRAGTFFQAACCTVRNTDVCCVLLEEHGLHASHLGTQLSRSRWLG